MIVQDLIKKVRFALADVRGERWTDERLLLLLNDCILTLARKTNLFVSTLYVKLYNNQVDYNLSEHAFKIIRVELNKKPLPFKSFLDMDKEDSNWQTKEGEIIKAIVIDKQREANFKVYPILKNTLITSGTNNINYSGNFGIITGITYSEIPLIMSGTFGDISPVIADGYLKVYYIKKYPKFTDVNEIIEVSTTAEEMLYHYIVGMSLRDNQDTQSRVIAKEELDMYETQLNEFIDEKAKNFSQATYEVPYNAMG